MAMRHNYLYEFTDPMFKHERSFSCLGVALQSAIDCLSALAFVDNYPLDAKQGQVISITPDGTITVECKFTDITETKVISKSLEIRQIGGGN